MKSIFASVLVFSFASASFADVTCAQKAEQAAAHLYAGGNAALEESLTTGVTFKGKKADSLRYDVTVFEQYSDGASTIEMDHYQYHVVAKGNAQNCVIVGIRQK